jgi:hypothetical protein
VTFQKGTKPARVNNNPRLHGIPFPPRTDIIKKKTLAELCPHQPVKGQDNHSRSMKTQKTDGCLADNNMQDLEGVFGKHTISHRVCLCACKNPCVFISQAKPVTSKTYKVEQSTT